VLLNVGHLADEIAELAEMDLNPIVVGEHGVVAVDAKIRLVRAPSKDPADFRRMRL
jgi:ATP-grasp domain